MKVHNVSQRTPCRLPRCVFNPAGRECAAIRLLSIRAAKKSVRFHPSFLYSVAGIPDPRAVGPAIRCTNRTMVRRTTVYGCIDHIPGEKKGG